MPLKIGCNISSQHHHLKEVRKAVKKAKTFEIQKLVKKLKGLRFVACSRSTDFCVLTVYRRKGEASQEIADLEAQLDLLKVSQSV
jgi:hypothetical protein